MLTCKTGGFVALCHNEIVNITPDMLSMICRDELTLSTSSDNNDGLQANISMGSLWQRLQKTFLLM